MVCKVCNCYLKLRDRCNKENCHYFDECPCSDCKDYSTITNITECQLDKDYTEYLNEKYKGDD